jgi:hypothetical protein
MSTLILKRASANRRSGQWSDNDYDVLADGVVVGRIMKTAAKPADASWLWTLAYGQPEDRTPDARLRTDPRGRDGRVRQELAEGVRTPARFSLF